MTQPTLSPFIFLPVTQQAALAAYDWVGRGDKHGADAAAVEAMRHTLNALPIHGTVVIGEGEMDEAPMLYIGEKVGMQRSCDVSIDLALDPLDGTTATAKGMDRALCVLAGAPSGHLLHAPDIYMDKLIAGPRIPPSELDLDASVETNVHAVARALNKPIRDVGVCLLDRPRHADLIDRIRKMGARVHLITDGDVSGALYTLLPESGIDLYLGTGGAPEGVIVAAAIVSMGGSMQARLVPQGEAQTQRVRSMGLQEATKKLHAADLAQEPVFFLATGVTHDTLLPGVCRAQSDTVTHTLVLSSQMKGQMIYVRCCSGC